MPINCLSIKKEELPDLNHVFQAINLNSLSFTLYSGKINRKIPPVEAGTKRQTGRER